MDEYGPVCKVFASFKHYTIIYIIFTRKEEKALKNEEDIRVNQKMLYEKHRELSERLQCEVHRNALGLAEVKGMLRGIEGGGGSGRGNVRGRVVQEGRKYYWY